VTSNVIRIIIIETDKIIIKTAIEKFVGEQTSSSAVRSLDDLVANVERLEYKCGVETAYSSSKNSDRLVGPGARRKGKGGFSFFHWRGIISDKESSIVIKYGMCRRRDFGRSHDTSTTSDN
jgi:hypothetical protein